MDKSCATGINVRSTESLVQKVLLPGATVGLIVLGSSHAGAQTAASGALPTINVNAQAQKIMTNAAPDQAATAPIHNYVPRVSATATKTATPLIETPQSVSVVGQEQIRDLNLRTIDDALDYSSGVHGNMFGFDTRNNWFTIRGFPAQVDGYFLDGLQLPSPGFGTFDLEPFDLERLEVLKGPSSVLYGGSTTGGIVNAVSKRPYIDGKQHNYVETGVDNYGNGYGAFDFSGPVSHAANNQFYYRVVGLVRGGGTQVDYTNNNRYMIAPSLTWAPDAFTSVTLLTSYQKDDTKGENFLPYVGTVQPAPFGRISSSLFTSDPGLDTFQRNQAMIGYTAEHRFNDIFTVRQNMRYSDLRVTDRTLYGLGYDGPAADAELERGNFISDPHVQEFALDTSVEAKFLTGPIAQTAISGIDYKHYVDYDSQGFGLGPDLNLLNPQYYTGTVSPTSRYLVFRDTQDQLGEYLQDQIKFERFTLVLSGRHDGLTTNYNNILTPTSSVSGNDDAYTGRVGLIYTSAIGLAPYVTAATSFDPQLGTNSATQQPLVPETGALEEVGVKYQPVGMRLSFDAALFNLTQNNVLTTDPTNVLNTIQTGQETSKGFELEGEGDITDGLKLLASYTGYQLRDTSDLNPAYVGKVPAGIPQNYGALYLDYTIQSGMLRGFGFGAGPRYVGGSYAQPDDTYGVPGAVLADAGVHYEWDHWRASINVRNLLDKTYVSSCSSTTACFYGERRTALFSLGYHW
jgi:iron complex outermembrane recepter protein